MQPFGRNTPTLQTDEQRSDSKWQAVLQTVTQNDRYTRLGYFIKEAKCCRRANGIAVKMIGPTI